MNEYDDILNRIVEEFYDTGRLVLNEERWTDNVSKFYEIIRDANNLYNQRLRHLERNQQKGIDEKLLVIEYLIDLSNRYSNLFEFVDTNMTEDEIRRLSRGGEWEWSKFRSPYLSRTDDLKEALKKQRNDYFRKTTEQIINVFNFKEIANIKNEKERLEKYKKLKTLIERLEKIPSYNNYDNKFLNWVNKSISDLEKKLSRLESEWFKKYEETEKLNKFTSEYINNMKDLYKQFKELSEEEKFLIIDYFKDVRKFSIGRTEDKFLIWIDNLIKKYENSLTQGTTEHLDQLTHYLKSTITQQDSEKSFDEVVSEIGVDSVDDNDFPDILSNYFIDDELLGQRKEILDKINDIKSKIDNINDDRERLKSAGNKDWENEGKTKLPKYENEKKNLEEQLRIIDPIKALFDSDSGWGNNYINCRTKEISDKPTNKNLEKNSNYSKYLKSYYETLPKAHEVLLNDNQFRMVNKPNSQIGTIIDCEKYNLKKLTTEIGRVSNREDIKNELTNNFTEYKENDVISNLVNKTINLVDNIFKMIIDKEILSNTPLQKYKSYMNMIKIYSQGENQKEKLTQLVYDLNQLKSIVESYDTLTGTADSPQSSDEEDGQEEGTKLLSKTKLQSLLNDISKNSWDKEKVKDYFVKVREHNNVAYEKSFEKKCNEIQYFEKVTGGDSPRIIDETNNNTHLVNYILSAVTENNYITTEKIVETIFSEVKDLLNNEDAIERRLKKYDLKVLSGVTLTQKNGSETFELLPSEEKYIEVKDTKPKDYHFSEFFGVYKSTKSEVYKRMKNLLDDEETDENKNFERYNEFVEGLVEKFKSEEGKQIIDIIKSKLRGVFFEKYEFCPIDNIKFTWSTVGQGKEGNREKRVTIRIEPIDYDKIYVWKEGNSNCGRFKFDGCEENPGCTQNESTDRLDEIIENFFDTGKFVF